MAEDSELRPEGVTAVAVVFCCAGIYLIVVGGLMILFRGSISMTAGSALLSGLELAGPYMFLLMGAVSSGVGYGLLRLKHWARWLAIVAVMLGAVTLIPIVSAAAVDFRPGLLWSGVGLAVRAAMVWYLYQAPVREAFLKR